MPYQRGQFWIRRFRAQAEALCAALAALTQPAPAPDFVHRALTMLAIHRLDRRSPLPVRRRALPPAGLAAAVWLPTAAAPHSPPPPRPPELPHTPFAWNRAAFLLTLSSRRKLHG